MQCKGCAETGAGCCADGHPRRHYPPIRCGPCAATDLHSAGCGSHQAADSGTRVERCTACLLSRCCSVCAAGHPRLFSQKSGAVPQILRCAGGLTERQSQDRYDGYRPCSFGRSETVYLYPYRKPIDLQINRKKSNLISKIHNVNDCKLSKPTKNFFWRLHS